MHQQPAPIIKKESSVARSDYRDLKQIVKVARLFQ